MAPAPLGCTVMWTTLVAVLSLSPRIATGHAGDMLDSLDVHPASDDNSSASVESTIGLLWAENGLSYQWVCHEAVTREGSLLTPRYRSSSEGYTLAIVPRLGEGRILSETLYRSTDHCDWNSVNGLTDRVVVDVSISPRTATTAYAVIRSDSETTENGLWVSTDSGQNWSATSLLLTGTAFTSVQVTSDSIWVSSIHESSRQASIYRSTDSGQNWQDWQVDLSRYSTPLDIQILDASASGLWFRVMQTLTDDLWYLDPSEASPQRVIEGNTKLMSLTTTANGRTFVSVWNQGISELKDGLLVPLPDSPRSYAVRASGDILYAATRQIFTGQALMRSKNQRDFADYLAFSEVKPYPTCASTSHSAQHCEPLWETLAERLSGSDWVGEDTGQGQPSSPSSPANTGGCFGTRSKKSLLLGLFPLGLLRRRRAGSGISAEKAKWLSR